MLACVRQQHGQHGGVLAGVQTAVEPALDEHRSGGVIETGAIELAGLGEGRSQGGGDESEHDRSVPQPGEISDRLTSPVCST